MPWEGREWLRADQSPWPTVAPSPIAYGEGWHVPHELTMAEIRGLVDAFVGSAERAKRIGFDVVELHSAHGYLLHQFLSPLSNQRKDAYGRERMKFPLEVARAVREVWPGSGRSARASAATTGADGGLGPDDAVAYARELERAGFDYVCASSGGLVSHARSSWRRATRCPSREKVKKTTGLSVRPSA